jgi:hypothetical protein
MNSYSGIVFSRVNGGTGPVMNGIYGTPLSRGVEIDNIVDVGRIEWIDFSPDYWSGSGLPSAPSKGSAFERWIYDHGTGIVMRRNDWSYTSFVTIEGYNKGFLAAPSIASPGAIPNGHHYSMNFINCQTAIYFEAVNGVGIMFTRIHIAGSETGVAVGPGTEGAIQLNTFDIEASANAIVTDASSKTKVMAAHGTVAKGKVSIEGGTFAVSDTDFNNEVPQIQIGKEAQSIITGNRFKEAVQIDNRSRFISAIDQTASEEMKLPDYPVIGVETRLPKRLALYVATEAPFRAKNDGIKDSTAALQAALDQAAADGGGIVFLPPGKYKVLGNLTIPSGVELKGAVDNSTVPTGVGSIIEVYAGRGHPEGTSFLKMSASSGLRGITFDYPEQMASQLPYIAAYPFLIQVTGSDTYIINVGMRAAYNGIDLFTYRTDNHYLDFVTGHVFHTGVKAGGGATGGKIYNLQFNPIVYAAGSESKFGSWPNSPPSDNNKAVYDYGYNNLDFLVLGDVRNETLYNDFHYGSQRGVVLEKENGTGPSGVSLGLGVDGAKRSMVFEAMGAGGFAFINTQIVSIGSAEDTRYIETGPAFEGEAAFYSSDFWGSPAYGITVRQGKVSLQLAHFQNPGQSGFATLDAGSLLLDLSSVGATRALLNIGAEPRLSVRSSIVDAFWINRKKTALWQFNLFNDPILAPVPSITQDNEAGAASPAAHSPDAAAASADAVGHVDGKSGKGSPHLVWIIAIAAAAVLAIAVAAKKSKSAVR